MKKKNAYPVVSVLPSYRKSSLQRWGELQGEGIFNITQRYSYLSRYYNWLFFNLSSRLVTSSASLFHHCKWLRYETANCSMRIRSRRSSDHLLQFTFGTLAYPTSIPTLFGESNIYSIIILKVSHFDRFPGTSWVSSSQSGKWFQYHQSSFR